VVDPNVVVTPYQGKYVDIERDPPDMYLIDMAIWPGMVATMTDAPGGIARVSVNTA
jgi:hypothetical protein